MIQVILCADAKYVQHLGVTLASLLSTNPDNKFLVTIVSGEAYRASESNLAQLAASYGNASLQFKKFDLRRVANLRTGHGITGTAYVRLFLTEFFDDSVSKVLYLDSDLVICRDISPLWNTDISDYALGAVRDHSPMPRQLEPPNRPDRYFNSGVLLVNLDRWRRSGAPCHLIEYGEKHSASLFFYDQDVLNAVYAGETQLLDLEWNFQARMADCTADQLGLDPGYFAKARKHPAIVHFSTSTKPWDCGASVNYGSLYFKYLALTPWRGYTPPGETLRMRIARFLRINEMGRQLKQQVKVRFPQAIRLIRRAKLRGRFSPRSPRPPQPAAPLDVEAEQRRGHAHLAATCFSSERK